MCKTRTLYCQVIRLQRNIKQHNTSKMKFGLSISWRWALRCADTTKVFKGKMPFFLFYMWWKKRGTKVYTFHSTSIDQLICKKSSLMWLWVIRAADSRTVCQNKHGRNTKIKITSTLCRWTNKIWKTTRQAGKGHNNFNTMWEYVSIEKFWDLTNCFCP